MPIPELARDERFRQRFLREAQIAAALDEPHVVPTVAVGEDAGMLYLAMAYIDGLDLREILRREGPLDPERAVELIAQVAGALDAAHARGLVHRDVKPGNVLVASTDAGEHAYLCDFGLAKHISSVTSLTGDRNLVGTIAYISPEQIEGSAIDARADVYSLGCMLFECLTGQAPFTRESELAAVYAHMNEAPPLVSEARPGVSAAFDAVVVTAMAKAPGRPVRELRRARRGERGGARGAEPPPPSRPAAAAPSGRWRSRRSPPPPPSWPASSSCAAAARRTRPRLEIPPKSLGLIDARSHEVVGGIPFASQPWDVAFGAGQAWALLGDERRVARVDIASRKVLSTTTLPFTPGGIATGGGDAWVTEDGGDGLVRLDGTTGAIVAAAVRSRPGATGGTRAQSHRHRVRSGLGLGGPRVRDGARRPPQRRWSTASRPRWPRRPWSSPTATSGWRAPRTAGSSGSTPSTNRITAVTPLHGTVTDLAVGSDSVWVSIVPDDVVFRLSPDDGSVLATLPAGAGPSTLSAADGVWIADAEGREIAHVSADGTRDELPTTGTPWAARCSRRPAVGLGGRRPAARRLRREHRGAPDPLATDALGDLDPAVVGGPVFRQLAYSTCAHLLNYPDAEGSEGRELRPEVAAAHARRLGGRPDLPVPRAPGVPLLAALGRGGHRRDVPAHHRARPLAPARPGRGAEPLRPDPGRRRGGDRLRRRPGAPTSAASRPRATRSRSGSRAPAGDLAARLSTSTFCPVPVGTPPVPGGGAATPIAMAGPYYVAAAGGGQTVLQKNPNYTGSRPRRVERIVYTEDSRPRTPSPGCSAAVPTTSTPTWPATTRPGRSRPEARSIARTDRRAGPAARAGRATWSSPAPGIDGIAFNTRRPLFRDARMRRAVGYALDRTALAAVYAEPPSDHLVPPAVSGLDGNVAYPNEPDLHHRAAAGGRREAYGAPYCAATPSAAASPGSSARTSPRSGSTCRSTSRSGA